MISDFESPPGQACMSSQENRQGYWYVYFPGSDTSTAPEAGRKQTPALNNGKPIATEPAPDANTCNQFALHSTASGFNSQYDSPVGLGAFFLPQVPWDKVADAYDVSKYTGISFKIKSGSGTPPAVFFEVVTRQTMPTSAGGSASDQSLDLYTTRGQLLASPWAPSDLSTAYQTFTVPFGSLVPRWLPTTNAPLRSPMACTTGTTTTQTKCQVKPFAAKDVLGIRYSMYLDDGFPKPAGSTPGTYDLWIDDVAFVENDAGLPARKGFPLRSPGSFGKCSLPNGPSVDAKYLVSAYNQWKARFVRDNKVIRPDNQNDTLSEGIAFGMLIAVNLNDQPLFDGLYGTWKSNPAANAGTLMKSCLGSGGGASGVACTASDGSDTGADQDAAYALLMADRLWGGTYKADAVAMLKDIWDKDMDGAGSKLPKAGSGFQAPTGTKPGQITRPSTFAPSFYRLFASTDPDASHDWTGVIAAVYAVIKGPLAGSNGLVPGWCGSSCTVAASNGEANDTVYQYDSHRVPMRMALDYCFYETAKAKAYTDLTTHFFTGAANDGLGRILDLYTTTGGSVTGSTGNSASLLGTAAVGAMASGSNSSFLDNAYQTVFDIATRGTMATPSYASDSRYAPEPTYSYANATVGLLTLLIMTGNFPH
jgi:endo-1,4-beta-D-glucanase Y